MRRLRGPAGSVGERAVQEGVRRLGLNPTHKGSGKGLTDSRVSWGIQGGRGVVGAASMEQGP